MSQQCSSAGRLVLITVAEAFLVAVSAQCQSRPVPQVASCSPIYQGVAAGGQANDAIDAAGAAMREVKAKSFPELARVDLRAPPAIRPHPARYLVAAFASLAAGVFLAPPPHPQGFG